MFYPSFTRGILECKHLNATYELNKILIEFQPDERLSLQYQKIQGAIRNKINYYINNLCNVFNSMHEDYSTGTLPEKIYVQNLIHYNKVLDNSTGLPCYNDIRLDLIRQEISDKIKNNSSQIA